MDLWRETKPTAKRRHTCDACGQAIEPGEQYAYIAYKWEGEFYVTKQHLECREAECSIAQEKGLYGGEDWIHLNDLEEPDDLFWLRANHPAAFERIKAKYACWLEDEAT